MIIDRDMSQVYDIMIHVYIHAAHWRQDWHIEDWYTQAVVYRAFVYIIMVITCLVDK